MKNIHILKTNKPSRLLKDLVDGTYQFKKEVSYGNRLELPLNIYITSDEEIKEGDWVIKKYETKFPKSKANEVLQVNKINTNNGYLSNGNYYNFSNYLTVVVYDRPFQGSNDNDISRKSFNNGFKKIILTTDQDLIKDGVQEIDDEFLEWFVENPNCEEVEVVDDIYFDDVEWISCYKIIIPKKEQKQHLIDMMKADEEIGLYEELKQETVKEAAEKFYPPKTTDLICSPKLVRDSFIAGAKWQQEQQYKFAIEFGDWIGKNTITYNNGKFRMKTLTPVFLTSEELLEQFKKK